jgi:branched-chain amino acid transport system substrate-binding protein
MLATGQRRSCFAAAQAKRPRLRCLIIKIEGTMKKPLLLPCAAFLLASLTGHPVIAAQPEPLKLATLLPVTGPYANYAVEFRLGFEIARDELNAAGGIAGRQIQLAILDTQSNNGQVVSLMRQACADSIAVLGPSMSNEAQVAFPVANGMTCPAISSSATSSGLTDKNRPWTFTYASPASIITPEAVALLADKLKPKHAVVVIDRGDAAANDQGPLAEKTLKAKGVDTQVLTVSGNDLDFGPVVTRIGGLDADLVVLSTTDKGAVGVLKELKRTQSKAMVLITQSAFTPLVTATGAETLEGVYRYTEFDPMASSDPRVANFVATFKSRNNGRSPTQLATQTYDLLFLVKYLIEQDGVVDDGAAGRKAMISKLAALKDWPSISGPMSIAPGGYAMKPVTVLVFHDGKPQRVPGS